MKQYTVRYNELTAEQFIKLWESVWGNGSTLTMNVFADLSHCMVVEFSPWLSTWYEQPDYIRIPIEEFDFRTVSLTCETPCRLSAINVLMGKSTEKSFTLMKRSRRSSESTFCPKTGTMTENTDRSVILSFLYDSK